MFLKPQKTQSSPKSSIFESTPINSLINQSINQLLIKKNQNSAGSVLSFQPIPGYECLLTQKRCNVAMPYISVGSDDETNTAGDDLSNLSWIANSDSYMCFTELEALRRFVRMRLRVPLREATGVSRMANVQKRRRDDDASSSFQTKTKREEKMTKEKRWTWVDEVAENLERENARAALRDA